MCRQGFQTGSHYCTVAGPKRSVIILPPCPKYWDYRYIPPWWDLCVCVWGERGLEPRLALDSVCSQGYPEHLTILLCLQSPRITGKHIYARFSYYVLNFSKTN